jgi:peptidoglycan/xylan/chitin deacetylase (PgdA/CDA1 family)
MATEHDSDTFVPVGEPVFPWYSGGMRMIGRVAAATGLTGLALGAAAYSVRGRSSQVFGQSVYRGPGKRRSIALTFDDGPSPGSLALLDYLGKEGVKATFFQCGANVLRHPDISRRVSQAGHEIGNHTYSHARLCPTIGRHFQIRSPQFILDEFSLAQAIIQAEAKVEPTLLRAPYGLRWYGIGEAQQILGLLGVMWTVIGHDWEYPSDRIFDRVRRSATPGGIVCLHDGRDIQPNPDIRETIGAVKQLIPWLKDQGYAFETVSEILH